MPGRTGEQILNDILSRRAEVYGPEADDYIRGISDFSSRHELYEWWTTEIAGSTDRDFVRQKAEARFAELMQRSSQSGWGAK
ncbi:MAG: hypothetical protein U0805_21615 [Pirellulales bacterium]